MSSASEDEALKLQNAAKLLRAIEQNDLENIKLVIDANVDINTEYGESKFSGVHLAALLGYEDILSYILKHGAKADKEDIKGRSPLYYAATEGKDKCLQLLIKEVGDLNKSDHANPADKVSMIFFLLPYKIIVY